MARHSTLNSWPFVRSKVKGCMRGNCSKLWRATWNPVYCPFYIRWTFLRIITCYVHVRTWQTVIELHITFNSPAGSSYHVLLARVWQTHWYAWCIHVSVTRSTKEQIKQGQRHVWGCSHAPSTCSNSYQCNNLYLCEHHHYQEIPFRLLVSVGLPRSAHNYCKTSTDLLESEVDIQFAKGGAWF